MCVLPIPSPRRPYHPPSFVRHHIKPRSRNVVIRSKQRSMIYAHYFLPSHCRVRRVIPMSRSYRGPCLPVGHLEAMQTAQIGVSASYNSCDVEMTIFACSKIKFQDVTTRWHCCVLRYDVCVAS